MSETLKKIIYAPSALMDMWIWIGIGVFTVLYGAFASDEAAKYIPGLWIFLLKTFCQAVGGGLAAAKMYRSTGFAEHLKKKESDTAPPFRTAP